jgi:hypothetical protein
MTAAKGYTSRERVARYLGRTLTTEQMDQADALIASAEAWIDRRTHRAWLVASPIVDELHQLDGAVLYLKQRPVTSVSSVKVRSASVGATETALVAGTDYELLDPVNGVLSLGSSTYLGYLAKVSYVHSGPPVPEDIALAATMLVATFLQPALDGVGANVQSYRVGGELQVTFTEDDLPKAVKGLVNPYRRLVFA